MAGHIKGAVVARTSPNSVGIDWRWFLPSQVLLVITWLDALEVFGSLHQWGFVCLFASIALAARGIATDGAPAIVDRRQLAAAAGVLACLAWTLPYPINLPPAMLASAAVVLALMSPMPLAIRCGAALAMIGLSSGCQGLGAVAIRYVSLRARYLPVFNDLASPILGWLGLPATCTDGVLYINTSTQLLRIVPNVEKLGVIQVVIFLAGILPWLLVTTRDAWWYLKLIVVVSAFLVWRYILLLCLYSQTQLADWFWDPVINALGLFVLAACIHRILPRRRLEIAMPGAKCELTVREAALSAAVCAAATAALGWAIAFEDPGVRKQGRVIVDESHSDWERTEREYDTQWYGDMAGYNYATLYKHLGRYYSMKRHEKGAIDRRLLADCDVLILKTPTRAYADAEIATICAFVARGGGLYLIGDHTNVFGMTTYLNGVVERFGFAYGYDATYEMST